MYHNKIHEGRHIKENQNRKLSPCNRDIKVHCGIDDITKQIVHLKII